MVPAVRPRDTYRHGLRLGVEWAFIALAVAAVLVAVVVPRLAGATPYAVRTDSMRPGMPPGTLVVVRPVDPATLGPGDVITFLHRGAGPRVVTHRIVAQGYDMQGRPTFTTRGDANPSPDPQVVQASQVYGERWYHLPYLGHVTVALTAAQRSWALKLVGAGLLGYAVSMYAGALRDRRRPGAPATAPTGETTSETTSEPTVATESEAVGA